MATSYPYGFDARSSPKTNENLNGTELALSFALIASRGVVPLPSDNVEASVVVDEPDWSRIFEERFKMQISSSRREKTYTMYSNENEHVGEQLLEDQRKRTREDETITSDTKKANASDPKIEQDFISEEEFSDTMPYFQMFLVLLNNEQIRMIGEMVKYEGIHGAVCKLRKIIQNIEELNLEEPDLFDDELTNNKTLSFVLE
ncbi:hypothetical protein RhiirA4_462763 [Rhizophagus irregularis]|uniref:Uncharacterized protein n=1 Tax=Rhizophagus irregularis TaxID=588596 RepID=A0A2I1GLN1_9GLOM|nr:hypothetical protein RhiirA4_462763 [Rhizophagus irregularis]